MNDGHMSSTGYTVTNVLQGQKEKKEKLVDLSASCSTFNMMNQIKESSTLRKQT
jgi:hypothetical protein